ncbi:hypothetical protein EVAR_96462_1 [Eumeta japonica]|uniref:Uncharacterized protein n=1 Tax=Eumeta variegata TaxID=151549 RepID=A0A4C1VYS2_EUMVA|nr:hypothetical protein EVAR_96462_1 [Eumeta japonica]
MTSRSRHIANQNMIPGAGLEKCKRKCDTTRLSDSFWPMSTKNRRRVDRKRPRPSVVDGGVHVTTASAARAPVPPPIAKGSGEIA